MTRRFIDCIITTLLAFRFMSNVFPLNFGYRPEVFYGISGITARNIVS